MSIRIQQFPALKISVCLLSTVFLFACAKQPELSPGAKHVAVSLEKPPANCKFIGKLHDTYGNVVKGQVTATKQLRAGAVDKLRNEAYRQGANYVYLVEEKGIKSGAFDYDGIIKVSVTGEAYRCK